MAIPDNDGKPEEHTVEGQTFYNAALTGSGTINPDGTYGPPLPDPTIQRGGPVGARKSPGGVERPEPNTLIPPAVRAEIESALPGDSKPRNQRSTK